MSTINDDPGLIRSSGGRPTSLNTKAITVAFVPSFRVVGYVGKLLPRFESTAFSS